MFDFHFSIKEKGLIKGIIRAAIERLVLKLSYDAVITVSKSTALKLMKRAHVLVLPSLAEGFRLVLVEAMVCGTPVIATNLGGMKEIIIDEETGYLVDPLNTDQLAGKIIELLINHKNLEKWDKGRKRVKEDKNNKI